MGNYNANPNPDIDKIRQVAFGFALAPQDKLKSDQFSTTTANKVYSMVRKIGSTRVQFLVDPDEIPG